MQHNLQYLNICTATTLFFKNYGWCVGYFPNLGGTGIYLNQVSDGRYKTDKNDK